MIVIAEFRKKFPKICLQINLKD